MPESFLSSVSIKLYPIICVKWVNDLNILEKWNVSTSTYSQEWAPGKTDRALAVMTGTRISGITGLALAAGRSWGSGCCCWHREISGEQHFQYTPVIWVILLQGLSILKLRRQCLCVRCNFPVSLAVIEVKWRLPAAVFSLRE